MPYDAIIIGAGMSGLAAGIRLALFDRRVVILERHSVWGGLSSFYKLRGHQIDVGLHAMTNYAPRGARGRPLSRLLRQLRLRHDELDLQPQGRSRISFSSASLAFSNDPALLRAEVARVFPDQASGFDALIARVRATDALDLQAPPGDARQVVRSYLSEPLLVDMLLCPLMFYGSAREDDMDWLQFVVMFQSIFLEGFARPQAGVRHLLKLLVRRYRALGGELRIRAGVRRLLLGDSGGDREQVRGVLLDDGAALQAPHVLSSAGWVETMRLAGVKGAGPVGRLSFTESIAFLDRPARDLGIDDTIVFFSDRDRFSYRRPEDLIDAGSGVICVPGNFALRAPLKDPVVRITQMASYPRWADLSEADYRAEKARCYERSAAAAAHHVADFRPSVKEIDHFTPLTIRRFTGHLGGAVYGCPIKRRTGETGIDGLRLIGTDQGFLGIVGAMLSGITIANRWVLQEAL